MPSLPESSGHRNQGRKRLSLRVRFMTFYMEAHAAAERQMDSLVTGFPTLPNIQAKAAAYSSGVRSMSWTKFLKERERYSRS